MNWTEAHLLGDIEAMEEVMMSEAPERIYMDPDIKFPECEKQYGCDVEYIRADLVEAAVKRALEGAANCLLMFSEPGVALDYSLKDEIEAIRSLASDPAEVTAIIKKAGEDRG